MKRGLSRFPSAVGTTVSGPRGHPTHGRANSGAGTRRNCGIGAEHPDTRPELGAAEGHHVLSNMSSHNLPMLRVGVRQDVLDQVVAVLVTGDVDERDAWTVNPALTDAVEVAAEKLRSANLQTLLHYFGGKLIHAVLGGVADDVVNRTAAVRGSSMFADVLNAPVAKLTVSHNVNVCENFLDAGALG